MSSPVTFMANNSQGNPSAKNVRPSTHRIDSRDGLKKRRISYGKSSLLSSRWSNASITNSTNRRNSALLRIGTGCCADFCNALPVKNAPSGRRPVDGDLEGIFIFTLTVLVARPLLLCFHRGFLSGHKDFERGIRSTQEELSPLQDCFLELEMVGSIVDKGIIVRDFAFQLPLFALEREELGMRLCSLGLEVV